MNKLAMINHVSKTRRAIPPFPWFAGILITLLFLDAQFPKWTGIAHSKLLVRPLLSIDHAIGCAFSPDGLMLAIRREGQVDLVNSKTGQLLRSLPAPGWPGRHDSLAFSPDGKLLAIQRDPPLNTSRILAQLGPMPSKPHSAEAFEKAFDKAHAAAIAASEWVDIWETCTWQIHRRLTGNPGLTAPVVFSGDGTMLATGRHAYHPGPDTVTIWSTATWRPFRTIQSPLWKDSGTLSWHVPMAAHFVFSSDSRWLFTAGEREWDCPPPGAYLWNVRTGKIERCFGEDPGSHVSSAVFTRDGKEMITSGSPITRWNTRDWKSISGPEVAYGNIVLSPDGKFLAVDGWEGELLSASTLRTMLRLGTPGRTRVCDMVFSPDSRILAVSEPYYEYPHEPGEGRIQLWSIGYSRDLINCHFPHAL